MFSGNPSDAYPEIGFTTYLASLPTTWDDTHVIDAKLGDYLVVARRKDNDWYLAAMTDWTAREIKVSLSFLGSWKIQGISLRRWNKRHQKMQVTTDGLPIIRQYQKNYD